MDALLLGLEERARSAGLGPETENKEPHDDLTLEHLSVTDNGNNAQGTVNVLQLGQCSKIGSRLFSTYIYIFRGLF